MSKYVLSNDEKKMLKQCYLYSLNTFMAFNHVVMEGQAFGMSVWPAIDKFYKTEEEKTEAFARNATEFFNTHQVAHGLITGVVCAMEKKRAEDGDLDASAISSLKASLMGPTAGVFDSFFFNCVRVIVAGICIGLAKDGSLFAPLLFLLVYGGGLLVTKYVMLVEGYKNGINLINVAFEKGIVPLIMEACGILGSIMIGTLIATSVKVSLAWTPEINGAAVAIQGIFDNIMPGILSLGVWWASFKALQKGITPTKLIFIIMGICIALSFVGIL